MAITRTWKVYGAEGHRQAMSFGPSVSFKPWAYDAFIEIENSDKTGTNEYSLVRITADAAEQCERRLWAQIDDGYFEDARVGVVVEVF